jgi:hypothetical protein
VISVRYKMIFFVLIIVNCLINVARSVTHSLCPGVPGSSLGCVLDCLDRFLGFLQSLQTNSGTSSCTSS